MNVLLSYLSKIGTMKRTKPTQAYLGVRHALKSSRRLVTKQYVAATSGKRHWIYHVLKSSGLCRLEDVQFTTYWRRLICDILRTSDYNVFRTSYLRRLENVSFMTSDVLKTSVKRSMCSNVIATSIQHQKKWLFLIFCTVWNIQKNLSAPV